MDYKQAEALIFNQLPMFSKQGQSAINYKLTNIKKLCACLNNPQNNFKSIHVAGTNGKGSTCHMLSAIFQNAGYKTGLYTSPHLVDIRERVRINGQLVSKEIFVAFANEVLPFIDEIKPSYFELNVALAFYAFSKENVDIAIIETGLGGIYDSTNIIHPILSIITHIALDHVNILGDTLEKIAYSKAGIIKNNVPCIIGKTQVETTPVFLSKAADMQAPLIFADQKYITSVINSNDESYFKINHLNNDHKFDVKTDLKGTFQAENINTVYAAIQLLIELGWNLSNDIFLDALKNVINITGLRGRWHEYRNNIILDVAHNPDGMKEISSLIDKYNGKKIIVYASVKDKDVNSICKLLPEDAHYLISQAAVPRAMPIQDLENIFIENNKSFETYETISLAVKKGISLISEDSTAKLYIIGSFFTVGEAYQYLDENI